MIYATPLLPLPRPSTSQIIPPVPTAVCCLDTPLIIYGLRRLRVGGEGSKMINQYGQESESVEIGFLWGPKHEQFSNASLSALNLKKHFET